MRETVITEITGAYVHGNAVHRLPVRGHVKLDFNEESLAPKPLWPGSKRAGGSKFYKEQGADIGLSALQ